MFDIRSDVRVYGSDDFRVHVTVKVCLTEALMLGFM